MEDCLFCKIATGEIPSTKVYEDDHWFAFRDINPSAPVHVLLIPRQHVKNILALTDETNKNFSDFFLCPRSLPALPHISSQNPHYFLFTVNTTTITTELP